MKSTKAFCPCATGKGHDINAVLLDLLAELKGQHVWFKAAGEKVEPYRTVRSAGDDGAFSFDIVEAVIDGSLQSAAKGMLRYGMLEGNIGYIYFSNFTKNVESGFFKPSQPCRTRTA